jgi:putative addiction module killer protein
MIAEDFEIKIYQDQNGKTPFIDWLESLPDKKARAKIKVRLARIRIGNLGDWKSLGEGLYELRIDEGAGYRLYFTQESRTKIILLGGSKSTQQKDISKAKKFLQDYRR